jgi:hypothetical protein
MLLPPVRVNNFIGNNIMSQLLIPSVNTANLQIEPGAHMDRRNLPAAALTAGEVAATQALVSGGGILHTKFSDTFRRADTTAGSIAGGWSARGPFAGAYPLPAATGGSIVSQAVQSELTTYWMRALPSTPKKLQVRFSYLDLNNGNPVFQTLALICTNSAANLVDNMGLHLTTNHAGLLVQERILATGAAFVNIAAPLDIQPRLNLADGENVLTVELEPDSNGGTVWLNQFAVPFSSPNFAANIGPTVAFETFNPVAGAVRWRLRIHEFSASW